MARWYAEIILPLPIETTFTYAIPAEMESGVKVGHRVIVPFGRKKYYTGIVRSLTNQAPQEFETKDILAVLDEHPIVRHPQLKLWEWVAEYYMCAVGDVYKAGMPSGLKVESETFVEINPDYEPDEDMPLDDRDAIVLSLLTEKKCMAVAAIAREITVKNPTALITSMIDRGLIVISEKIVERYRAEKQTVVIPTYSLATLSEAFAEVKSAKKQERLLMTLTEMSGVSRKEANVKEVGRKDLLERSGVTAAVLSAVVKKGLARMEKREVNRFKFDGAPTGKLPLLTQAQMKACDEITDLWREKSTVLLHGVTSSGKTEIYSHLIDAALSRGEQVLYLVPEIALTTQLTRRLQDIFGNNIVVYHSKFSDNERVDIWKSLLADQGPKVILGARSSLFLPFGRLGLVIVDEEHESSYKQADPAPRYNARDVALVLASMHGAKALLGSATPSIETYYKALNGKFGLVTLTTRYNDLPLPPIHIVDMKRARQKGAVTGPLSLDAIKSINDAVEHQKQAILFRNRRGYAPMVRCKQCAWVPKCQYCDVSLTYHNHSRQLVCHYCGAVYQLPDLCPQCRQPSIEIVGYGTERVEGEIETIFPARKVLRMDLDTTRNKDGYETIIDAFSSGKADILVGTQMVTKGLDFRTVSSVVVMNADELINVPDFKASERAFNMLEQVSGRAGRGEAEGSEVVVQTYNPDHPILKYVQAHAYNEYYNHEIAEREQYRYPPFARIIYIYLKHADAGVLQQFSNAYAQLLASQLGSRVSGPDQPRVTRVKSLYIQKIMIKVEPTASLAKLRYVLRQSYEQMAKNPAIKNTQVYYDVDP
ncbi:MAG: primosomal protein N' [Barnesiella sp.]|nr:primosomal protein N' [Barnesiella sp.]